MYNLFFIDYLMALSSLQMKFVRVVIFQWRKLLIYDILSSLLKYINYYRLSDGSVINGRQISEIINICTPTHQRYQLNTVYYSYFGC
jgi:hypothetical protein